MKFVSARSAPAVALIVICFSFSLGRDMVCDTFAVEVPPLPRSLAYSLSFFFVRHAVHHTIAVLVQPLPRSLAYVCSLLSGGTLFATRLQSQCFGTLIEMCSLIFFGRGVLCNTLEKLVFSCAA